MELDPFTKKLLERTKARRENLDKKEANLDKMEANKLSLKQRKRRSPMSERINFALYEQEGDTPAFEHSKEDSPKRHCKDVLSSDKANNYTTVLQSEKENTAPSEMNISQQLKDSQCLKRKNSNNDEEQKATYGKQKAYTDDENVKGDTGFSSQARLGCKKRLAALALQINQWEDDTSQFPSENCIGKATQFHKSLSNVTTNPWPSANQINMAPLKESISNTASKDTADKLQAVATSTEFSFSDSNQKNDKSPPHPTQEDDEIELPVSIDVSTETKTSPKKAVLKYQQQESQGFTKSPSASKLQYEYAIKSKMAEKQKLEFIQEDTFSSVTADISSVPKKIKTVTFQEPETSKELTDIKKQVDPAELPLSARRALFEKAFSNGNVKNFSSDKCETLSVAEKTALFEKASTSGGRLNHPIKLNSVLAGSKNKTEIQVQQSENLPQIANKQISAAPAVSNISSPSKTIPCKTENHSHQIKQQLSKDNEKKWQDDINPKNKLERKQEMAALLNRWEHVSSAQPFTASKRLVNNSDEKPCSESVVAVDPPLKDDIEHSPQGYDNSQILDDSTTSSSKLSFAILHDDPNGSKTDDVVSEIEACESNSDLGNESYDDDSENKGEEDISSMQETRNITEQAVAVCDEINELLEDALDSSTESESVIAATPTIINSTNESEIAKQSLVKQTKEFPTSNLPPLTIVEGNTEVPLLHTVSVYRRQKQELQLTPVKKIIRREQIESPPSPDDDEKIAVLQEKLKALQEEVLAQQTIISQASQALNLCQATTEFTGSTEQVEAERLLLVATQKRQAYLNEIHRLKTDRVLGHDGESGSGTLTISDISLGIKHEFLTSKSEGKSENNIHYFICLIRCGAQLIATQMLSTEDGIAANSLNFTNHITIQELRSDFSVSLEVYALQARKEMIPHNKKYHIKKDCSKLRLTPKVKKPDARLVSPAISSPGGPNAVRTPSFGLVGFTRLVLRNVNRSSYILEKVPYISPLDGIMSMKVQLHAKHGIVERGFLNMFEDVSGFGAWHRRWCILQGNHLAYWKYPEDDKKKDPIGVIDLCQCVTPNVKLVSRDICARPHTFQLVTIREQEKGDRDSLISQCKDTIITTKHLLSADTKEERILWCNRLNDVLSSIRKWDPSAVQPIERSNL